MALRFLCQQCNGEIVTQFLNVGDQAKCTFCGSTTPVPRGCDEFNPPPDYHPKSGQQSVDGPAGEFLPDSSATRSPAQESKTGSVESRMDQMGMAFLMLGFLGSAFGVWNSLSEPEWMSGIWHTIAFASLFNGFVTWLLFSAGATVIRLLKKLNDLPFNGEIS